MEAVRIAKQSLIHGAVCIRTFILSLGIPAKTIQESKSAKFEARAGEIAILVYGCKSAKDMVEFILFDYQNI